MGMDTEAMAQDNKISLDHILSHANVDGKCYRSDIAEWLGVNVPSEKLDELQDLFTLMRKRLNNG